MTRVDFVREHPLYSVQLSAAAGRHLVKKDVESVGIAKVNERTDNFLFIDLTVAIEVGNNESESRD